MFFLPYLDTTLQDLSNGTKNTKIVVRMTKLWSYEVSAKTGKLQKRRNVENQCRDVAKSAETKEPDVVTLPKDVAIFKVGVWSIFS